MNLWVKSALTGLTCSVLMLNGSVAYGDYIRHNLNNGKLVIEADEGKLTLTPLSDSVMEADYQLPGRKSLPSFSVQPGIQPAKGQLSQEGDQLVYSAGNIKAVINKSPLQVSYFQGDKLLIAEEQGPFAYDGLRGFRFRLQEDEKLLGTGERVLGMDRRGHRLPLYNRAHYGYETESSQMYFSLPMVTSSNKYMLLFDNAAKGHVDLGHSGKNILQFEASGGRTAYVVVAGKTYPDLLKHYTQVTGRQPLPPLWAMGNYASRFGYRSQQQVENVVERFIQSDIPLDALVLDLYWFGKDIQGHMGNLDWDRQAFPEPEKMIKKLKDQGVETILITEPFVLTSSKKWQSAVQNQALALDLAGQPKRFDFYFGNTGLIDVFNPQGRQWFNDIYQILHQQGVSGWWGDLGEPEVHPADTIHTLDNGKKVGADEIHNAYGHRWAQMVYENQLKLAPEQRPFIMMRAGFAGSQRFGMIPWTGDVNRSWGGFKPQVELALQMSMMGFAYIHSDLGGFAGGETFDPELYIRWLQYGAFQPVYRPHAQEHIAPEPVFHDQSVQDIVGRYIKLRYRMLPYNYTLAYENHQSGMPMMRPLMFENENDLSLFDNAQSYLWGDSFLVTPVTEAGATQVKTLLPAGIWFDYWTDKVHQGNQFLTQSTDLNTLPVLVRAGSFVPMANDMSSTKHYRQDKLTLHYYAHPEVRRSEGQLYQDNGQAPGTVAKGQYQLLVFSSEQHKNQLSIKVKTQGKGYQGMPDVRHTKVVVHHWTQAPTKIMLNSQPLSPKQWQWDETTQKLTLTVKLTTKPLTLQIR